MTSGTGSAPHRAPGFTMVELLVTISIIVTLMALLMASAAGWRARADRAKAESQLQMIQLALENYHSKIGSFPPDGFDREVRTPDGTLLYSAAALTYALEEPLVVTELLPNGKLREHRTDEVILTFDEGDLFVDPDDPQAREVVDPWDNAFHYDSLAGGADAFSEQDSCDIHLKRCDSHGIDPRQAAELVETPGAQNTGQFDLWSAGAHGHSAESDPSEAITTWIGREG